jgi:hypothetical protein
MISNFDKEIGGVFFHFRTMNVKRLQLFQVYVQEGNQRTRFHMQVKPDGNFSITDPTSCPEQALSLEQELNLAILAQQE